jgi:hypothetical protein
MSAAIDYLAGGNAGYTGMLEGDIRDTAHVAPYVQTGNGMSWWEGLIQYGVTRAIDNRLGPTNTSGNTQPGSYQGAGGRTGVNTPSTLAGGSVNIGGMGVPVWLLAGVAVVAVVLAVRN